MADSNFFNDFISKAGDTVSTFADAAVNVGDALGNRSREARQLTNSGQKEFWQQPAFLMAAAVGIAILVFVMVRRR